MNNILDYSLEEVSLWMKENGESSFRAQQVFTWIYKNTWNFEDMKNSQNYGCYLGSADLGPGKETLEDETQSVLLEAYRNYIKNIYRLKRYVT